MTQSGGCQAVAECRLHVSTPWLQVTAPRRLLCGLFSTGQLSGAPSVRMATTARFKQESCKARTCSHPGALRPCLSWKGQVCEGKAGAHSTPGACSPEGPRSCQHLPPSAPGLFLPCFEAGVLGNPSCWPLPSALRRSVSPSLLFLRSLPSLPLLRVPSHRCCKHVKVTCSHLLAGQRPLRSRQPLSMVLTVPFECSLAVVLPMLGNVGLSSSLCPLLLSFEPISATSECPLRTPSVQ